MRCLCARECTVPYEYMFEEGWLVGSFPGLLSAHHFLFYLATVQCAVLSSPI